MLYNVRLQMNGFAFSHYVTLNAVKGPIKEYISLVESYCMWGDLSVNRIYFSITNSSSPSNQCCPLNGLNGNLYSKSSDHITVRSISKGALFENWQVWFAVLLGSH